MSDAELIELGQAELTRLGIVPPSRIREGAVVRMEKAYPVYDGAYQGHLDVIRAALAPFTNLQVVGRNGMHKYNNQDHSMMTALLAAKNLTGGRFNLWNVNTDAEYHEEVQGPDKSDRQPRPAHRRPRVSGADAAGQGDPGGDADRHPQDGAGRPDGSPGDYGERPR
eukprot:gene52489-71590_t